MTKQQLQKELLEKVKPGTKPSTLKKSKSLNDLPNPVKSLPLKHSHSTSEIPLIPSDELEDKISVLELTIETKDRELEDKDETIRELRKQTQKLEEKLTQSNQELDTSLLARYEALKQFDQLTQKLKDLRQELEENITQSTDELINQDEEIRKLRTNQIKAQSRIQELENEVSAKQKDLNLAQRLTKLKEFYPTPENDFNYLKYSFYGLILLLLTLWLTNTNKRYVR